MLINSYKSFKFLMEPGIIALISFFLFMGFVALFVNCLVCFNKKKWFHKNPINEVVPRMDNV